MMGTMASQFSHLQPHHRDFIAAQHIFFTASAAASGHVNVSPRSTDMFRVLGDNTVMYLDRTGSGNETAAHLRENGRLTIMFCAVAGPPLIMRLYGKGHVIHRNSAEFAERLATHYDGQAPLGARQMIHLDIDLVQTSCGYGVPLFEYQQERPQMDAWARAKGPEGIEAYWHEKNRLSLDGLETGLFEPVPAQQKALA
jgi:predicted pyridoxine 5'-phosphate oxidase superfamily flavin-nucleotide-binding protein